MSKIDYSRGDFSVYGVNINGEDVTFTFFAEAKEGVGVLLFDVEKGREIHIKPDETCRQGNVYSVTIKGIAAANYVYRYECDGREFLDPYAVGITGRDEWGRRDEEYCIINKSRFNKLPAPDGFKTHEMIVYKLNLRGFTADKGRGDVDALISRIPYIRGLGVNTVELFPIYEFNEILEKGRTNLWGYTEDAFFMSPKASYFGGADSEAKLHKLIEEFEKAGIRVILEFCFNDPTRTELYLSAVRHWSVCFNPLGFSFIGMAVPVKRLIEDPLLAGHVMFFEKNPSDMDLSPGEGRVFVKDHSYLFPLRRLQNQTEGSLLDFTSCYLRGGDIGYVNYAAASNGFTLYDSFAYSQKHNEDNGEDNTDGANYNCVYNNGAEGETKDRQIKKRRADSIRFALASVLLSRGIPLIAAGDECENSAGGNNNPYCQDNPTGWINFSRKKEAGEIRDYVKRLIEFRKKYLFRVPRRSEGASFPKVSFHGNVPWISNVEDGKKSVGIMLGEEVILLFNFNTIEESFALPKLSGKKVWKYVTDTSAGDFCPDGDNITDQKMYKVGAKSLVVLLADKA